MCHTSVTTTETFDVTTTYMTKNIDYRIIFKIMTEIKNILYRLTVNDESLIENVDNNPCEQFDSLINKHIVGKNLKTMLQTKTMD